MHKPLFPMLFSVFGEQIGVQKNQPSKLNLGVLERKKAYRCQRNGISLQEKRHVTVREKAYRYLSVAGTPLSITPHVSVGELKLRSNSLPTRLEQGSNSAQIPLQLRCKSDVTPIQLPSNTLTSPTQHRCDSLLNTP